MASASWTLCTRTKCTQAPITGAFCKKRKVYLSITFVSRYCLTSLEYRATSGGLLAITHFLQQAINHNEKELPQFDVRTINSDLACPGPSFNSVERLKTSLASSSVTSQPALMSGTGHGSSR